MKIGEKIKKLRSAKVMTQTELAGGAITRNMLSQIENGLAQPSLGTVRYLASRLNVSPSYLLAEDNDEMIYLKNNRIADIRNAYAQGNYRLCLDICRDNGELDDDEIRLILAESNLGVGIEEFNIGNLHAAVSYFDSALEYSQGTIYNTDHIELRSMAYFSFMRLISATLSSDIIDDNDCGVYFCVKDDFCKYSAIFCDCEKNGWTRNDILEKKLSLMSSDGALPIHIQAKLLIAEENYSEAHKLLHSLLYGELKIPEPVLYIVFSDLEGCCKELGDFKGAYEYSQNKVEVHQKLLT